MSQFIRQLTGVRFVAAFWVLLYHYQPALLASGLLVGGVHEFVRLGSLGVDLFFGLSGFILTHTYLTKLGPKLTWHGSWHFWALRLARVYPVYFVMLNVAGLATVARGLVGAGDGSDKDWLNARSYLAQVFMVQEWGPNPSRGWNFVAWSVSMEWLAYLLFPLFVLLVWRLRDRLPAWALAAASFACLVPLLVVGLTRDYDPFLGKDWGSTIRILTEFAAGAFVYLFVRRVSGGERVSRVATGFAVAIPVAIVVLGLVLGNVDSLQWCQLAGGGGYGTCGTPGFTELLTDEAPQGYVVIVPLLIAWIGALALTNRGPSRVLAKPALVLGGYISYSLYMVHMVWYQVWRAGMDVAGIESGPLYLVATIALFAGAIGLAYLMWRLIEEPAREWLRSRLGAPPKPVEEAASAS